MVDIDSHRVIDLIASRETVEVTEWLKTYPNLQIVSRDGSVSYKSAIEQTKLAITQVSDRFHLLKGLTDAAKKLISRLLPANFALPVDASHGEDTQTGDYWDKPVGEDGPTVVHNANFMKKQNQVNKVRNLKNQGFNNSEIAGKIGINRATVAKYLNEGYHPASAYYNATRSSKIKPYAQDIKRMLSEGKTFRQISEYIHKKGFTGAESTIRMFATRERKLRREALQNQEGKMEKMERKWLISLLYRPIDEAKFISQEQLDRIIVHYPVIGSIYDIVKGFKETLFSKKESEIEKWLEDAESLEIDEINSFIHGVRRDITAIKNAILLEYNNGLAEGSVNKLKVVKRIMYGRSSFELLKSKLLRLELKHKIN